ncbi:hypothetical protein ACFQ60_38565 [Streptomyces zhihengii]
MLSVRGTELHAVYRPFAAVPGAGPDLLVPYRSSHARTHTRPQALDRLGAYPAGTRLDGPDGLPRPDGLDATVVPKWTSQEIPQRSCMPSTTASARW